ncbi:MAG: DMT family transporter [Alphaproteobacteria bacterium]|jgi:drug/metabolite transporter (DMT)-like permease
MTITPDQSGTDRRRLVSGYALLTAGILFWAGNAVVGRAAAGADIPPLTLNFFRWSIALVFFLVIFGRSTWAQRHLLWQHRKFIVTYSVLTIVGFNCTFYVALQKTTVLQASLIQSILPVLVLLLALVVLKTRITGQQWWGVVFSIGGAALIIIRGDWEVIKSLRIQDGDIWALVAVLLWSLQAFLMRYKPKTIDIMPFMTALAAVGVIVMTPMYIWESTVIKPTPFTQESILLFLYLGLFAGFLGTTAWNEGTYRTGPAQAGYFGNLYPVFAGGLAILLLGETLHWYHMLGAVMVVTGIWLAIFHKSK